MGKGAGVPIPHYDDEPLKRLKGFFGVRTSSAIVGERSSEVFVEQPHCWVVFHPLLLFPANVLCRSWGDVTLQFVYGPLNAGGTFFKVTQSQQLVFLGTTQHGRLPPGDSALPFEPGHTELEHPISPGFIEFHDWIPGETESDDESGFHEVPAVFLGGDPGSLLDDLFPPCLCCHGKMRYVGQLETDAFSEDLYSVGLVLLYCERCEVQCNLDFE